VTSLDGQRKVTATVVGTSPETAGTELAAVLKERGADAIPDQIREPAGRQAKLLRQAGGGTSGV
jgi:hypothetical protein